jgi:hypothetical protein
MYYIQKAPRQRQAKKNHLLADIPGCPVIAGPGSLHGASRARSNVHRMCSRQSKKPNLIALRRYRRWFDWSGQFRVCAVTLDQLGNVQPAMPLAMGAGNLQHRQLAGNFSQRDRAAAARSCRFFASAAASRDLGLGAGLGTARVERIPSFSRMPRSSLTRGDSGKRSRSIVPRNEPRTIFEEGWGRNQLSAETGSALRFAYAKLELPELFRLIARTGAGFRMVMRHPLGPRRRSCYGSQWDQPFVCR